MADMIAAERVEDSSRDEPRSTGLNAKPDGPQPSRSNNFDFLRFAFAALYGFFVISGYLITISWRQSNGVGDFFRKRVLRIYPGFIVATLLCAVLFSPLGADNPGTYFHALLNPAQVGRTVKSILLLKVLDLPASFTHLIFPEVDGSIWTIQYEFICYAVVAALGLAGLLARKPIQLLLFGAVLVFTWADTLHPFPWLHNFVFPHLILEPPKDMPPLLTFFLAGMACALYRDRLTFPSAAVIGCAALFAAACFVPHGLLFALPFVFPYLVLAFAFSNSIPLSRWGKFGDLSYGLYLYAWPVQQLLIHGARFVWNPNVLSLVALCICCCIAKISWELVERPCLRLKGRNPPQSAIAIESSANPVR
jgi:peptidoglycan/LPS O-acetylase OafA/YrhL